SGLSNRHARFSDAQRIPHPIPLALPNPTRRLPAPRELLPHCGPRPGEPPCRARPGRDRNKSRMQGRPMSAGELAFASIEPIAQQLWKKNLSPLELIQTMLARIERFNPQLNAYLTVTAEQALGDARRAEREILRGHWRGPLHGVPISLKDNIYTLGVRTTAGSKILCDFVPQRDATVV